MIVAAQVVFSNQHGDACLTWLSGELEKAGVSCSPTEWRGYGAVVFRLLVPTAPVPLTIQVDADPAYVPEEIAELAEDAKPILSAQVHERLARCDARLDIMSTTPPKTTETETRSRYSHKPTWIPNNPKSSECFFSCLPSQLASSSTVSTDGSACQMAESGSLSE